MFFSDIRNKENTKSSIVDCFNIGDSAYESGFDHDEARGGIASHVRLQNVRDWLLRKDEFQYPKICSLRISARTEAGPEHFTPESFEVHEHLELFFTD
eukprot:UN25247